MNPIRGILSGMILTCGMLLSAKDTAARLNYRICVPDQPTAIEAIAAGELAAYLEKTYTGKIRLNGSDEPILFSVGFAPEAREFSKDKDAFTESGFGVFCRKRTVLLTGLDDSNVRPCFGYEEGTLLSVYYFLRRYTGLKIYAPDPVHGEKPGRNPELKIPSADKPAFSFSVRGIGMSFADFSVREMALYSRKQLCHNFYWTNANVYYIVLNRWGKRFKDQPEMLGLHKGKRQCLSYPFHLPCLTNPKVKEVIVSDIFEMIRKKKDKDRLVLRVFSDAPIRRCECANCARFTCNEDYLYGFILSVWEAVKKRYPETRLVMQEKDSSHRNPPSSGDLSGVVVDITTGFPNRHDYRRSRPLFRRWQERGAQPTIRLYPRLPWWGICPIINPHDVAANFRAMKGYALGQRTSDHMFYSKSKEGRRLPYSFAALTNYVHVNCLLNADADPDELIREFCSFMYPGAAKEMIEFYAWMEKRLENLGGKNPYLRCYPYDMLDYPISLLDAAAKKCTDSFWLNKLRTAFDAFVEDARKIRHLTVYWEKNFRVQKLQQAEFRKKYSKPFRFGAETASFPLCPLDVPTAKIQDTSVRVRVWKDRLVFHLTALEEHIELLKRDAAGKKLESIWGDDSFEIFIASGREKSPYLHFTINANGAVLSLRHRTTAEVRKMEKLTGDWKSSAAIGKDRWTADFSVPLSLIREICPDGKGRIGVFRTRILNPPDPKLRNYYFAHSGLDAEALYQFDYHDISRYHAFILPQQ